MLATCFPRAREAPGYAPFGRHVLTYEANKAKDTHGSHHGCIGNTLHRVAHGFVRARTAPTVCV